MAKATPEVRGSATVDFGNDNTGHRERRWEADYFEIRNLCRSQRSTFDASAVRRRAKVVVIGSGIIEEPVRVPHGVGQSIRLNGQSFAVGCLKDAGQPAVQRGRPSLHSGHHCQRPRVRAGHLNSISGRHARRCDVPGQEEVVAALSARHRIRPDEDRTSFFNQADITESANQQPLPDDALAGIACVSLIGGGIALGISCSSP